MSAILARASPAFDSIKSASSSEIPRYINKLITPYYYYYYYYYYDCSIFMYRC